MDTVMGYVWAAVGAFLALMWLDREQIRAWLKMLRISKQSMLERVEALEKENQELKKEAAYIHGGIVAVLRLIEEDRQRYRSPAAKRIRFCLGSVREGIEYHFGTPPEEDVQSWIMVFNDPDTRSASER